MEDEDFDIVELAIALAGNPQTPKGLLRNLLTHDHEGVIATLASNPSLPLDIMEDLLGSGEYVGENVASNPTLPSRLFDDLASSYFRAVRESLAERKDLPLDLLMRLVDDEEDVVLRAVLSNPHTPPSVKKSLAERLGRDDDDVSEPSVAPLALDKMNPLEISQWINRQTAIEADDFYALGGHKDPFVRASVARKLSCPRTLLVTLSEDPELDVRLAAAGNKNAPVAVLEALARDEEPMMRATVASNPNVAPDVLFELADDPSLMVRVGVAQNIHCEAHLISKLAAELKP